jgi:hypothetical protein
MSPLSTPAANHANPNRLTNGRGSIRVFCPEKYYGRGEALRGPSSGHGQSETAVHPQNVNRLFTVTGKKLGVDEGPSPVSTRRLTRASSRESI